MVTGRWSSLWGRANYRHGWRNWLPTLHRQCLQLTGQKWHDYHASRYVRNPNGNIEFTILLKLRACTEPLRIFHNKCLSSMWASSVRDNLWKTHIYHRKGYLLLNRIFTVLPVGLCSINTLKNTLIVHTNGPISSWQGIVHIVTNNDSTLFVSY